MSSRRSNREGGLRTGSLSTFDSVVMAVAGCGPAYTVVALVPALVAAAGFASPAVLLYCAFPIVGIALALRHLGRLDVSSGATYSWVSRTLHPFLGFLSGWAVVVATTLFIFASTTPAGSATLSLFDKDLAGNDALATVVGLGWFLLIAALVASGAKIAARVRAVAVGIQLALLLTVAVAALTREDATSAFSFSWFGPGHFDATHTFTAGALIASALYWGWDVTANLSEETRGGRGGSGLGGLIGLLVFAATLLTLTVAANVLLGPDAVTSTDGTFLLQLGEAAWPGTGGTLLVLAVPLSMVATLETTLLQATRTLFAMGRDRTIPSFFGRIHPRRQTPVASTLAVVAVTVAGLLLVALLGSGVVVLEHALKGIGLLIAFYYALAGIAVSVAYRGVLLASAGNLIFLCLWPLAGTAFNIWVFAASIPTLTGTELAIGIGLLALGLVPVTVARIRGGRSFFQPRPLNPVYEEATDVHLPVAASDAGPVGGRRDGLLSDF
ncbi:APC family permease [Streptomyces sp. NPDC056401]|uniref:APC family permease n=1 Tax=Streptomyces sp. NPDC056401 TaxID=3345809 RepID=UPI0035DA25E0